MKKLHVVNMIIFILVPTFTEMALGVEDGTGLQNEKNPIQPTTLLIKGGTFVMGSPLNKGAKDYFSDEVPTKVEVKAFRVSKIPVTAAEFAAFLNSDFKSRIPKNEMVILNESEQIATSWVNIQRMGDVFQPLQNASEAPAVGVTWFGAFEYCRWISQVHKKRYRLPTEAEWEFLARGTEQRMWPWGHESPDDSRGYRWTKKEWSKRNEYPKAGSFPKGATPEGVCDLMGYLFGEWCINSYRNKLTSESVNDTRPPEDSLPKAGYDDQLGVDIEVVEATGTYIVRLGEGEGMKEYVLNKADFVRPRIIRGAYSRSYMDRGFFERLRAKPMVEIAIPSLAENDADAQGRTWTRCKGHPISDFALVRVVEEITPPSESPKDSSATDAKSLQQTKESKLPPAPK